MNPDLLTAWRRVANDRGGPETVTMPRTQLRELIEHIGVLTDVVDLYAPDWALEEEDYDA